MIKNILIYVLMTDMWLIFMLSLLGLALASFGKGELQNRIIKIENYNSIDRNKKKNNKKGKKK